MNLVKKRLIKSYYTQTDVRWSNHNFGGGTMDKTGCGPTAIAILLQAHGKNNITPDMVAKTMTAMGVSPNGDGCTQEDIQNIANACGLHLEQVDDIDDVREAVENGCKVLTCHPKGLFTSVGHFLVYMGLNSEGKLLIADPNQGGLHNKWGDDQGFELEEVLKDLNREGDIWAWIDYSL